MVEEHGHMLACRGEIIWEQPRYVTSDVIIEMYSQERLSLVQVDTRSNDWGEQLLAICHIFTYKVSSRKMWFFL